LHKYYLNFSTAGFLNDGVATKILIAGAFWWVVNSRSSWYLIQCFISFRLWIIKKELVLIWASRPFSFTMLEVNKECENRCSGWMEKHHQHKRHRL
jgi:hypothetical protein